MTDTPDATGGDASRVSPVPSTGSGTSAAASDAASGPVAPEVAEPVEASGLPAGAEPAGAVAPAAAAEVAEAVEASGARDDAARQPVVRVRGARRARLLPAPGTTVEPAPADDRERGAGPKPAASGPNDDRMLREVPPHY